MFDSFFIVEIVANSVFNKNNAHASGWKQYRDMKREKI